MTALSQAGGLFPNQTLSLACDAIPATDTKGKSAVRRNGRRREDISGIGFLHSKKECKSIGSLYNEKEKAPFLLPEVVLRL